MPRVKARDKDGAETEVIKSVAVKNVKPVVTLSATTPTTIQTGQSVSFDGAFTDPGVSDNPWAFSWAWADGTAKTTGSLSQQGSPLMGVHQFNKTGIFKVQLTITDKDGLAGKSVQVTITVNP